MVQTIRVYSEKDIKKIVKSEISKKFHAYDVLLNSLNLKIIDLDRIIRRSK
jgi:hypothetical protein